MIRPGKKSKLLARKLWARLRTKLKEEVVDSSSGAAVPVSGFDRLRKRMYAAKREEVMAFCRAFDRLV